MKKILPLLGCLFLIGCASQTAPDTDGQSSSASLAADSSASSLPYGPIVFSDYEPWRERYESDEREPFNRQEAESLMYGSSIAWNEEPATETISFTLEQPPFHIRLPYNPAWGTNTIKTPPYEVSSRSGLIVHFGPLGPGEGGIGRMHSFFFTDPRSHEEAIAYYESEIARDGFYHGSISEMTIGGHDVIRFTGSGLCESDTYEVIGPGFNVSFWRCLSDTSRPETEQLIESMAFSD